jgi:integrase/recombinase XerD
MPTPADANIVRLAVPRAARQRASRPQQKRGLTHRIRADIMAACSETLAGLRDAAVISVGYDTLCRCSEISAMCIEHLDLQRKGTSCILIPRTKADVAGEGRIAHLSPNTVRFLRQWIGQAGLASGPLFRSLHLHRVADGPLSTSSIRRLIKRATERAGLNAALTAELSGHSMRIGAAQDMMVAGFDALAVMQAGG